MNSNQLSLASSPSHVDYIIPFSDLKFFSVLGEGSYGKVWKGDWKGCDVAIKYCHKDVDDTLYSEAQVLVSLPRHPNIVPFFALAKDDTDTQSALVMEYFPGGSVDSSFGCLTLLEKIDILRQASVGIAHLHEFNIIHRDLACRNLLMAKFGKTLKVAVSDFGFSRTLGHEAFGQTKSFIGPIRWMAPEAIKDRQYSSDSDVWSFGATMYELMEEIIPYQGVINEKVAIGVLNMKLKLHASEEWPETLKSILHKCLKMDPVDRLSMDDISKEIVGLFREMRPFEIERSPTNEHSLKDFI